MTSRRSLDRRRFLKRAGLLMGINYLACGQPGEETAGQDTSFKFQHPIGVQLYTLRDQMQQDPQAAIAGVAEIGFTEVEVLSPMLPGIIPLLLQHNLDPVSGHFPLPLITGNFDAWSADATAGLANWEAAVQLAQEAGLQQMVIAYVQEAERTGADFYRQLSDQMNGAGEQCRQAGLQLAYHHHAFEFEPLNGEIPFEILAQRFDPELVNWQLDVFWLTVAGRDPVSTLRECAGRVPSVHLKDLDKGVDLETGNVPREAFAAVGSGRLDFPAILKAADAAGVQHYFVEQDHTPGNPLESLRASYRYLKGLAG